MSLTLSVDTARSSLQATSEQISVVSRNIARVNDSDATRKTATLVSGPGVGVSIPSIGRTSNQLLFNAYLTANSSNQAQTSITSALDQLQNTVDDTDAEHSPAALRPTGRRARGSPDNEPPTVMRRQQGASYDGRPGFGATQAACRCQ